MPTPVDNVRRGNLGEESEHNWYGFYRAKVVDAHDLKKLGRVKVWIPDVMPEPKPEGIDPCLEGLWALPGNTPMGGRNKPDMMGEICDFEDGWYQGACLIPPKGSWVWVFFENGDPNWPYYWGSAETGARKVLPENQQGTDWEKKWTIYKTRMGRVIVLSDDADDERVEITGKKRLITSEPDGDDASVFTIDGNQTTIMMDERAGHEKILIRDYRGNYINMRTDDEGAQDQLHIFMQDDIHIETLKNLYIKTGEDMHVENGAKYKHHAKASIDMKADLFYKEQALSFDRFCMTKDSRTAGVGIYDTGGIVTVHNSGVQQADQAGIKMSRCTGVLIDDLSGAQIKSTALAKYDIKSLAALNLTGVATTNVTSGGPVNIKGAITTEQCGAMDADISFWIFIPLLALLASSATPANPYGERTQEPNNSVTVPPTEPVISLPPQVTTLSVNPPGDDYDEVERPPIVTLAEEIPIPTFPLLAKQPAPTDPQPDEPPERLIGVGHMFAISLKTKYRNKIIPLAKASGATHTGFYLLRDLDPGADNEYLDNVSVWNNYRQPGLECSEVNISSSSSSSCSDAFVPDWEDWNIRWWDRFDAFLEQANDEGIVVIPTLFDFCCSPYDPFVTNYEFPYSTNSWSDDVQGVYVRKVVQHLNSSGVEYILNLGTKSYNMNQKENQDLLPDAGYIYKLFKFLIEELDVPSSKIALTSNSNRDLYSMNPYSRWQTFTGVKAPEDDELNNEEYVDNNWGGTGRVAVYNDDGDLVDGYLKYLYDSVSGIPCMNTWKMEDFDDGSNDMNKMFAPRQREAMRIVYGIDGDGSI